MLFNLDTWHVSKRKDFKKKYCLITVCQSRVLWEWLLQASKVFFRHTRLPPSSSGTKQLQPGWVCSTIYFRKSNANHGSRVPISSFSPITYITISDNISSCSCAEDSCLENKRGSVWRINTKVKRCLIFCPENRQKG